jgi:hypothetical protein
MVQFGAGSDLAAQCTVAPTPDGWRPWAIDADGPVPDALAQRAQAIAADTSVPLGVTESYPLPGITTMIRVEPRVWGRDATGALVQGCFRTGGIYLPIGTPDAGGVTPPTTTPTDSLTRMIGWLTAGSLAIGTAATLASWGKK